MNKLERLCKIVQRYSKIAVAYSGGVDSTFLLYFIKKVAKRDVIAFTSISETYTKEELKFAEELAGRLKVRLIKIKTEEFKDKRFVSNPKNRCFYCKSNLFSKIDSYKNEYNFDVIFDGTNYSDIEDFRPGRRARNEFGVISPLELARITKDDIRKFSKRFKIKGYDRPANACLASRVPYGVSLDRSRLKKIYLIEKYIRSLGIRVVRLRDYSKIARIETLPEDFRKILLNRDKIVKRIKRFGYKYVTLDIEGYRTGSMNI